ncbi:MAG: zf-HC2 domain-containing protein [Mycobacteriaceae bacterium]
MEHLATEAVAAFVDGELSMTAYQRAAAHLSVCAECAADVAAQQYARRAVRSASPLAVPAGLRGLLCRIPETSVPAPGLDPQLLQHPRLP